MQAPLKGLRVVTTRPEHLAERLVGPLLEAGAEVVNLPLLAIQPLQLLPEQKQYLLDLDLFQKVVVISPTAAQQLLMRLDEYWPQWPVGINWYSVGSGTAQILEEEGLRVHYPATGDKSEDLLHLADLQDLAGQKLLLVKGQGGRELLHDTLVSRGASVKVLPLYERVGSHLSEPELAQLRSGNHEALVITSGDALQEYIKWVSGTNKELHLLVPSERLAIQAHDAGFTRVTNTQGAGAEAILQALIKNLQDGL